MLDILTSKAEKKTNQETVYQELIDNTRYVTEAGRKKKTNPVKYIRVNSELRRETDRAKEKFINEMCNKITKFQQIGRYDLILSEDERFSWYQKQQHIYSTGNQNMELKK